MIPLYRWYVSVVPLEGLKFFKCHFPLKILTIIELAVLHYGTTVQMMIFYPFAPHCQNEELLRTTTSFLICSFYVC
jgi:hypothetical protein